MPKVLGITHQGIEDVAAQEAADILGVVPAVVTCGIIFEVDSFEKACLLAYRSQCLRRVVLLLGESAYSDEASLKAVSAGFNFSSWLSPETTFSLRCTRGNGVGMSHTELERTVGGEIKVRHGSLVDLKAPKVHCHALVTPGKIYAGIDLTGFDLSKREHNIFGVQKSVKGDIAFALFRLAGITQGMLLDPFSGSGGVTIEAALFVTGRAPHYFSKDKFQFTQYHDLGFQADAMFKLADKILRESALTIKAFDPNLHYLNASRKNSKVAGVEKTIDFSRTDLDWLDLKLEDGSVDAVATIMPSRMTGGTLKQACQAFLKVVKKGGSVVLLSHDPAMPDAVVSHGLTLVSKRTVMQGQSGLTVGVFRN